MKLLLVVALTILAVSGLSAETPKLKDALGMPEAHELDEIDADVDLATNGILSDLLDKLSEAKGKIFEALERAFYKFLELAKVTGNDLGERVKKLLASIRSKIDFGPLKNLIGKLLGIGDNSTSSAPTPPITDEEIVEDLASHVLEEITSEKGLEKIRNYIEKFASKSELKEVHAIALFVKSLDNSKLKLFITSLLSDSKVSRRGISDFFESIKEMFKTFGSFLSDKFQPFLKWVTSKWADLKKLLGEKVSLVKAIAMELLGHGKTISGLVAKEAQELLSNFKDSLGDLYEPLMKKLIGIEDATTIAPEF